MRVIRLRERVRFRFNYRFRWLFLRNGAIFQDTAGKGFSTNTYAQFTFIRQSASYGTLSNVSVRTLLYGGANGNECLANERLAPRWDGGVTILSLRVRPVLMLFNDGKMRASDRSRKKDLRGRFLRGRPQILFFHLTRGTRQGDVIGVYLTGVRGNDVVFHRGFHRKDYRSQAIFAHGACRSRFDIR